MLFSFLKPNAWNVTMRYVYPRPCELTIFTVGCIEYAAPISFCLFVEPKLKEKFYHVVEELTKYFISKYLSTLIENIQFFEVSKTTNSLISRSSKVSLKCFGTVKSVATHSPGNLISYSSGKLRNS